jgi:hypothetical protein
MKKLFLALIIFTSCVPPDRREEINCKYQGAIIYEVHNIGKVCYDIKYKGEILTFVSGYDIDAGYKVGDTINKPCLK